MDMGTKDGQGKTGVSHGICPECLKDVRKQLDEFKERIEK
jgi:hypothetical protein